MSKIKYGGLDQHVVKPFEQQQFGTADVEGVNTDNCFVIVGSGDQHSGTLPSGSITNITDFDFADRSNSSSYVIARSSSVAATVTTPRSAALSVFPVSSCRLQSVVTVILVVPVLRRPS